VQGVLTGIATTSKRAESGQAVVMGLNNVFTTGATIMLIGFVTSLFYLSNVTSAFENPASAD
jgi:hypothetical protein